MSCKKYNPICDSCNQNDPSQDASCITYSGPNLTCSNINSGDDLETAFQKVDDLLCSSSGNYASYNKNCLTQYWPTPITTEPIFVNAITSFSCKLRNDFDQFLAETYTNTVTNINNTINTITGPSLTCSAAGVTASDGFASILSKYCSKFANINEALDISGVVWDKCLTVSNAPTTISEGFQLVVDQICTMSSGGTVLPTFNNISSCLGGTVTSNDSLESTIDKIKARLCITPSYGAGNISWGCLGLPSSVTSIEAGLQTIVTRLNQLSQSFPTFNTADFIVEATDPGSSCAGVKIKLATPINQDRLVAATSSDSTPGTLIDKLQAGTNISLDSISVPGKIVVNATGGSGDNKVSGDASDDTPNYLINKLNGNGSNGIEITPAYNPTSKVVDLNVSVNTATLFNLFLDELGSNAELYAKFCEKVRNCPSPCSAPTNVQIVQVTGPTTTTTTTTP